MADEMGEPFMPWQRLVADVGGELVPDSASGLMVPAYREVIVTVMRQSGKTTLVKAVLCERCLMWGGPQKAAYTAQTGLDGRQKFVEDFIPSLDRSPLSRMVTRYYRAADNTGMLWKNGSRVSVLSVGKESGHGKTLDVAIIDEAFADADDRREQALLPTMATRPTAQIWNTSTAGTGESAYLRRKVEIGRASVQAGKREGVAFFEWSIPDDEDVDDPDVWRRFMPAFGYTISEQVIRHARDTMKDGEFRRAYGNQWTDTEDRIIPAEWWGAVVSPAVKSDQTTAVFAIDARSDRTAAAIVACDEAGNVELVATDYGVNWLVDWFADESRRRFKVHVDRSGPLANVADDLERAGVKVDRHQTDTMKKACLKFYDSVADQQGIRVRRDDLLESAVKNATQRHLGDSWVWNRDVFGGDILNAMSLALWASSKPRFVRPSVSFA